MRASRALTHSLPFRGSILTHSLTSTSLCCPKVQYRQIHRVCPKAWCLVTPSSSPIITTWTDLTPPWPLQFHCYPDDSQLAIHYPFLLLQSPMPHSTCLTDMKTWAQKNFKLDCNKSERTIADPRTLSPAPLSHSILTTRLSHPPPMSTTLESFLTPSFYSSPTQKQITVLFGPICSLS